MKNHRDYDPRTQSLLENLAFAQFVDLCDQKDLEDRSRHFSEGFRQVEGLDYFRIYPVSTSIGIGLAKSTLELLILPEHILKTAAKSAATSPKVYAKKFFQRIVWILLLRASRRPFKSPARTAWIGHFKSPALTVWIGHSKLWIIC
jgi:hypothetical protein